MVCDGYNFCFSFWAIFCPFNPLTAQKIKIKKNEKNNWRYHHFTHVYQKLLSHDVWCLRCGATWTDGQRDRWSDGKGDIQRWVSHVKMNNLVKPAALGF